MKDINSKKAFLEKVWDLDTQYPAYYIGVDLPHPAKKGCMVDNYELMLQEELRFIQAKSHINDHDIPAIRTNFGTAVFPSAFSCPLLNTAEENPWAKPIIFDIAEKVYELKEPRIYGSLLGKVIEFTEYTVKATEGTIPIKMTDLQGPLDIAYLLWDSRWFFTALYDYPREVHYLLDRITNLIISFVTEQKKAAGRAEFIPCHLQQWIPWEKGITVSEDLLSILSPQLYEEFAIPYLNRISEYFGGIFIHSCGNITHNLPTLNYITGLRGIDFGATETPMDEVIKYHGNVAVVSPHVGLNKNTVFLDIFDYLDYVTKLSQDIKGSYIVVDSTNALKLPKMMWTPGELQKIYSYFKKSEETGSCEH